jgi:hypothetical protein
MESINHCMVRAGLAPTKAKEALPEIMAHAEPDSLVFVGKWSVLQ